MTSASPTLRNLLPVSQDYSRFNREERNYAAILYHLLLKPGNLAKFLSELGHDEVNPAAASLYFEYAYARDLWCEFGRRKSVATRNQAYHDAILALLRPPEKLQLPPATDPLGFNRFFVGPPLSESGDPVPTRASKNQIQMPGRWSQKMFDYWIDKGDRGFAERACKLKWAFNVKPDLVIQTSDGTAICVEIKVDSKEGSYSMGKDKSRFPMTQTAMQKYVLDELLGYNTKFVFLSRDGGQSNDETAMEKTKWSDVFALLMPPRGSAADDELPFVHRMATSPMLQRPQDRDSC